jgi:hypothetical protein
MRDSKRNILIEELNAENLIVPQTALQLQFHPPVWLVADAQHLFP